MMTHMAFLGITLRRDRDDFAPGKQYIAPSVAQKELTSVLAVYLHLLCSLDCLGFIYSLVQSPDPPGCCIIQNFPFFNFNF